jgi:hypothetical protein
VVPDIRTNLLTIHRRNITTRRKAGRVISVVVSHVLEEESKSHFRMEIIDTSNMEEPCRCDHCKEFFDLQDGWASEKWYENIIICEKCFKEEKKEIETDDEITELKEIVDSALYDLKDARKRLKELGIHEYPENELEEKPEDNSLVTLQYWDTSINEWVDVKKYPSQTAAWISLGTDNEGYRVIDYKGNELSKSKP